MSVSGWGRVLGKTTPINHCMLTFIVYLTGGIVSLSLPGPSRSKTLNFLLLIAANKGKGELYLMLQKLVGVHYCVSGHAFSSTLFLSRY